MASGKGKRFCIVGAGAVFVKNGKLHAEWVLDSLEYWPSHYTAQDADYHGNFNGNIFNSWFESLCGILQLKYGSCRIHMDGASYHKIQTNAPPPSSAVKAELVSWLRDKIGMGRAAITKREWVGAYKKVQLQKTAYINEAQAAAPAQVPAPTREE
ncbi:unnamed protein product [Phytophthora fragariaefolia]|uniref:Unnamed protein product n=1 Tax=Phytophthora fragariaefolia TaxID=1490495 RepID=A0A9W7D3F8_9STRA|nr:unnamed protein product [Phytophthora fragariaefolia]